ncbi:hypothetical protein NBRC10512_003626 [Rhodotorula toruloides]|nr:methylitaconate delta-isomerase [Rhodotorula toruloides NP11]EMS22520.1 methylitaconate delta-isomerase [Rhodotorula toruloides NP11]
MPARGISASFWRGGTSRGLLFRAEHLAPFPPAVRERIILTALGSPDPAGRQIGGLGGGVSSLSKAAIVSVPGEGRAEQAIHGALPGVSWADDGERNGRTWDIVYRFAQVGVKEPVLDWSASCGNMFTAAALASVATPLIPYSTLFDRSRSLPRPTDGQPLLFPLSILSASNGVLMRARVPIDPLTLLPWEPEAGQGVEIAGVPGRDEAGIEVEMPLEASEGGAAGLVRRNAQDVVKLEDGSEVTVSVLTSGLPNVFLPISSLVTLSSLSLPEDLLELAPSALSSIPSLSSALEHIRTSAARQYAIPLSLASPKITLIGPVPRKGYSTTSGTQVALEDADVHVRAISSGDWHATIPGTTLGALNVGAGTPGTVIHELISSRRTGGASRAAEKGGDEVVTVRAGHAAGVAESSVRFVDGRPESVVMIRTAREIMRGEIMSPPVLTSALLAQQAIAAAASASTSRSSSRPRTLSGGKDLLREDVCDLSDEPEDDDTDFVSDEEDELIDERFLDPNSDEGIATRVTAYARELSAPAKRFLRTFSVELLRNATAYLERLEGDDLVLEARKGDEVLCLRRTNFQDLCVVDETRPLLQSPLDAEPTASLAELLRRGGIDSTETSARSPLPRRHPHPPSPADNTDPPARSRISNSARLSPQNLQAFEQGRLRPPRQPSTSSAPIAAHRSGSNYQALRAGEAANANRVETLMQSSRFHVATERRGTTALGRLLGDETAHPGVTGNAGDAVTTVEQDGQTSRVRVTAPERGVEFEMVLYEEEEVEEEQEGADDPAAEEAEREREETERREGSARLNGEDEIGR